MFERMTCIPQLSPCIYIYIYIAHMHVSLYMCHIRAMHNAHMLAPISPMYAHFMYLTIHLCMHACMHGCMCAHMYV
jgi:hypothetical protein